MSDSSSEDKLRTGAGLNVLNELSAEKTFAPEKLIGRSLGDYQITGIIAQGGMSFVCRGVRSDGSFDRDVAIKISVNGGVNQSMNERFLQEREILAHLTHNNISQLFDAGISEEGWPYFVMELVKGQPIDEFCQTTGAGLTSIIDLAIEIVDALAFAHARLIVHRDIKPSNIMVDAAGRPRLLDFGIAKMLIPGMAFTDARPMTPQFASPEQLLGREITIATDIYQIGLLLGLLLCGESIRSRRTLEDLIHDAGREVDLKLPRDTAANIPRDLQLIIERCLRTDARQRYADANALKQDLLRFKQGFPVEAAAGNAAYRLVKFIKRNSVSTAIAAVALVIIATGAWSYATNVTAARDAALLESKSAQRTTDFLVETFRAGDPTNAKGETITASALVDAGFERVQSELADEPEVQARLYGTLGKIYSSMGRYDDAVELIRLALDYRNRNYGPSDRESIWLQQILSEALRNAGERAEAEAVALEALEAHRAHRPAEEKLRRDLLLSIAVARQQDGNINGAADAYDEVLAALAEHGAENLVEEVWIKLDYAHMLNLSGKSLEAEELLTPAYPLARAELGDNHPAVLSLATNLAHSYYVQEKLDEAVPMFEAVYEGRRKTFGDMHADTLAALANLGSVQLARGDATSGEARLRAAVTGLNDVLGISHANTILVTGMHSTSLTLLERYDEAVEIQQSTLALARSELGEEHPYAIDLERFLFETYASAGYLDKVSGMADGVLQRHVKVLGEDHPYTRAIREIMSAKLARGDIE